MRYEIHRCLPDSQLHLVVNDATFYSALPDRVRNLGPWKTIGRGETSRLRLHYRLMLSTQGFVLIYQRDLTPSKVEVNVYSPEEALTKL